jgi:hypothetical protein
MASSPTRDFAKVYVGKMNQALPGGRRSQYTVSSGMQGRQYYDSSAYSKAMTPTASTTVVEEKKCNDDGDDAEPVVTWIAVDAPQPPPRRKDAAVVAVGQHAPRVEDNNKTVNSHRGGFRRRVYDIMAEEIAAEEKKIAASVLHAKARLKAAHTTVDKRRQLDQTLFLYLEKELQAARQEKETHEAALQAVNHMHAEETERLEVRQRNYEILQYCWQAPRLKYQFLLSGGDGGVVLHNSNNNKFDMIDLGKTREELIGLQRQLVEIQHDLMSAVVSLKSSDPKLRLSSERMIDSAISKFKRINEF